jgi:hypothetical protein
MKQASLRAWLRREPAPDKVKVRTSDGEERTIAIPGDSRNRWKTVEASIHASDAVAVSLFDKKDVLLRGQELDREGPEDEEDTPEARADRSRSKMMHEWTGMCAAIMHEQNISFDKGVAAAAQSQSSLTDLVDSMASHFATALTNIHTIVANQAIMQQQNAETHAKLTQKIAELSSEGGSGVGDEIKGLLGALLGGSAMRAAPPPPSNVEPIKKKG